MIINLPSIRDFRRTHLDFQPGDVICKMTYDKKASMVSREFYTYIDRHQVKCYDSECVPCRMDNEHWMLTIESNETGEIIVDRATSLTLESEVFSYKRLDEPPAIGDLIWHNQPVLEEPEHGFYKQTIYVVTAVENRSKSDNGEIIMITSRDIANNHAIFQFNVLIFTKKALIDTYAKQFLPINDDSIYAYYNQEIDRALRNSIQEHSSVSEFI